MTRDQFLALLTFWHLNDNENVDETNKMFKIEPLFKKLNENFQSTYYPKQQLSVDESMVPWKGRVSFRQFIKNKPVRYGMKLYLLCESETSSAR